MQQNAVMSSIQTDEALAAHTDMSKASASTPSLKCRVDQWNHLITTALKTRVPVPDVQSTEIAKLLTDLENFAEYLSKEGREAFDSILQYLPNLTTLLALLSMSGCTFAPLDFPLRSLPSLLRLIFLFSTDPVSLEQLKGDTMIKRKRANEWVVRCLAALMKPGDRVCAHWFSDKTQKRTPNCEPSNELSSHDSGSKYDEDQVYQSSQLYESLMEKFQIEELSKATIALSIPVMCESISGLPSAEFVRQLLSRAYYFVFDAHHAAPRLRKLLKEATVEKYCDRIDEKQPLESIPDRRALLYFLSILSLKDLSMRALLRLYINFPQLHENELRSCLRPFANSYLVRGEDVARALLGLYGHTSRLGEDRISSHGQRTSYNGQIADSSTANTASIMLLIHALTLIRKWIDSDFENRFHGNGELYFSFKGFESIETDFVRILTTFLVSYPYDVFNLEISCLYACAFAIDCCYCR